MTQSQQIRIYDWNISVHRSQLYIFHAFRLAGREWFRRLGQIYLTFSENRHIVQEEIGTETKNVKTWIPSAFHYDLESLMQYH